MWKRIQTTRLQEGYCQICEKVFPTTPLPAGGNAERGSHLGRWFHGFLQN